MGGGVFETVFVVVPTDFGSVQVICGTERLLGVAGRFEPVTVEKVVDGVWCVAVVLGNVDDGVFVFEHCLDVGFAGDVGERGASAFPS